MTISKIISEAAKQGFKLRNINKALNEFNILKQKKIIKNFDNDSNLKALEDKANNRSILNKISKRMDARKKGQLER